MRILTRDNATELAIRIQRKHQGFQFDNSVLFEQKITVSTFGVDDDFGVKIKTVITSDISDSPRKFTFVIEASETPKTDSDIFSNFFESLAAERRIILSQNADKFPQFK